MTMIIEPSSYRDDDPDAGIAVESESAIDGVALVAWILILVLGSVIWVFAAIGFKAVFFP